eukprot:1067159-Prymnesium_polylepis.1
MAGSMQSLQKDVKGIKEAQTGLERKVSGLKSSSETKTCFNCGEEGHTSSMSWNCPQEKNDSKSKAKKTKAEAEEKDE